MMKTRKMKRINPQVLKKYYEDKEKQLFSSCKSVIQEAFDSEPQFQKTIYEGKEILLNCFLEWESPKSLSFSIKTKEDIDLNKILLEKERGVGSKGISPNGALFRFKRNIAEGFKRIGFKRKQKT